MSHPTTLNTIIRHFSCKSTQWNTYWNFSLGKIEVIFVQDLQHECDFARFSLLYSSNFFGNLVPSTMAKRKAAFLRRILSVYFCNENLDLEGDNENLVYRALRPPNLRPIGGRSDKPYTFGVFWAWLSFLIRMEQHDSPQQRRAVFQVLFPCVSR